MKKIWSKHWIKREGREEGEIGERGQERERERERERNERRERVCRSIFTCACVLCIMTHPYDPNKRNTFDPSATSAVTWGNRHTYSSIVIV